MLCYTCLNRLFEETTTCRVGISSFCSSHLVLLIVLLLSTIVSKWLFFSEESLSEYCNLFFKTTKRTNAARFCCGAGRARNTGKILYVEEGTSATQFFRMFFAGATDYGGCRNRDYGWRDCGEKQATLDSAEESPTRLSSDKYRQIRIAQLSIFKYAVYASVVCCGSRPCRWSSFTVQSIALVSSKRRPSPFPRNPMLSRKE